MRARELYEEDYGDEGEPIAVGEGVELPNGTVILWDLNSHTITIYNSIEEARDQNACKIEYGHEGA